MFLKGLAELTSQQGFFPLPLNHEARHNDPDSGNAPPAVDHEGGADGGEIESRIDGMAQTRIGASLNKSVIFLKGNASAPELSEMIPSPDGDAEPHPGQRGADRRRRHVSGYEMATERSYVEVAVEEQCEANH